MNMIENQKIKPAQVIGPLGEPLTLALNASIHSVEQLASQAHVWWQANGLKQAI